MMLFGIVLQIVHDTVSLGKALFEEEEEELRKRMVREFICTHPLWAEMCTSTSKVIDRFGISLVKGG